MNIRLLEVGEEEKWYRLFDEESGELFTREVGYRAETHIVCEEGNEFIGGMELIIDEPSQIFLYNPSARDEEPSRIISGLVIKGIEVAKSLKCRQIFGLLYELPNKEIVVSAFNKLGFQFALEKVVYKLNPANYREFNTNIILTYRSLKELSESDFIGAMEYAYEADVFDSDAPSCFSELKRRALNTQNFFPADWEIAYLKEQLVGLTMPQLHDNKATEGSNFYVGVVLSSRNRGLGKILQQRAIHALMKRGAKVILGSCDIKNIPMIKIFESLNYQFEGYQYFYQYK